jgi:hypothetical protein
MAGNSEPSTSIYLAMLLVLAVMLLSVSGWLAFRNIRDGRGDRRGAIRLASIMAIVLPHQRTATNGSALGVCRDDRRILQPTGCISPSDPL